jgi:hypothetical protein
MGYSHTMKAAQLDERRRLVMPPECPPHSAVVIQQIDAETWIVRRQVPSDKFVVVLLRGLKHLPDDPEWEKVENKIARHLSSRLPEPGFDE